MRVTTNTLFNSSALRFGRTVDYGAKDKDLIYIPLLFEEPDNFSKSSENDSATSDEQKSPKKSKLKSILGRAGTLYATLDVAPDVVRNMTEKASDIVASVEDLANNTIESTAKVKANYKDKFSNKLADAKNDINKQQDLAKEDYIDNDSFNPFTKEDYNNGNNAYVPEQDSDYTAQIGEYSNIDEEEASDIEDDYPEYEG